MSSPTTPIGAPLGPATPRPLSDRADASAFLSALASSGGGASIEASRCVPPPEVLSQIAAAGELHAELFDRGRELRFFAAAQGAPARVELHDCGASRALPIAEALGLLDESSPE